MKIYVATFNAHFADLADSSIYNKDVALRCAFASRQDALQWCYDDIARMIGRV